MRSAKAPTDSEWRASFVLPGLLLERPIESDPVALVRYDDPRLQKLCEQKPNIREFLSRFTDAFGVPILPTVLLFKRDTPRHFYEIGCIAGFRNAVAVASVAYNRALELTNPHGNRATFGDTFAFYPWALDVDDQYLICTTPAVTALHVVDEFHGQLSAAIPRPAIAERVFDRPILDSLLARWRSAYATPNDNWADLALFRSLNMAYQASLIPAARDATLYDVGRIIALWVSAFEILIHPGGEGEANRDRVFALLERTPWLSEKCSQLIYETGGKKKTLRSLGCWLYQRLYDCRNDFLHGNPVSTASLELPVPNKYLHQFAAPLYRVALSVFLDIKFAEIEPSETNEAAFGDYHRRRTIHLFPQGTVERSLLTAIEPKEEDES